MDIPKYVRFDTFGHLDQILADFERYKVAARDLTTPNAEEDEFICLGMLGFSHHAPDRWNYQHFLHVAAFRNEVVGGPYSADWIRFTCLAAGYFLGMAEVQLIGDLELRLANAYTPGFMWLKSEAFRGPPFEKIAP